MCTKEDNPGQNNIKGDKWSEIIIYDGRVILCDESHACNWLTVPLYIPKVSTY